MPSQPLVYNAPLLAAQLVRVRATLTNAMRILLSNDDGYFAPGLERLAADLAPHAELTVVAPERDRSGASNSLTLDRPLTVRRAPNGFMFVNGTPTDCVHLAVTGLIAVSLASKNGRHFESAAQVIIDLVHRQARHPSGAWLLNVNVPDVPAAQLKGLRVTRLGKRHKAEPVIKTQTPRGETCYWVGAAGAAADAGEGTDFHAVESGFVSLTPLQMDLTHHSELAPVARWLDVDMRVATQKAPA